MHPYANTGFQTKENSLSSEEAVYFNIYKKRDLLSFQRELQILKNRTILPDHTVIFLCIGSDRATGDCFGPLVGETLSSAKERNAFSPEIPKVYGTLDHPVHAVNLEKTIRQIYKTYQKPYIIAIDASLGIREHIGFITLNTGPLFPGIGVRKILPEIGDTAITGIVNANRQRNLNILQTTRLSIVYHLAKFTSEALIETFFNDSDLTE